MRSRYSALVRLLGLTLLVLAVSPVTAPFSTIDLVGLLSGTTLPANASFNTKKAPEEPVPLVGSQTWLAISPAVSLRTASAADDSPRELAFFDTPLRI